ncbi:tryptophan 7-halogenase [uncultured Tenacibaculum sp.]|uniref:NAD(P)/FAD-dependent oxidoreductase n=1 Tax=uncultured Tenacibaculum sp. TaxID=174713 RepID=UPI00263374E9|nr:tryptophan 7-halogenase [uncultured Tenacibaculum sp.]
MIHLETDILIIGGGIAGCIAAISLANTHRVILIDKNKEPNERIGESLAPAAQRILKQLNLIEDIDKASVYNEPLYIKNMGMQSFWGSDKVHIVDHLRNPDGFVQSLNRKKFESYLRESALNRGIKCLWPVKLQTSNYETNYWHITANSNEKIGQKNYHIKSKFVIDASGRQSNFARSLGVKRETIDKLIACWATMPNYLQNTMSTISACKNGWWYSAVLPNNKRVMAFQTDADLIDKNDIKKSTFFIELAKENKEMECILKETKSELQFHGTVAANSSRLKQFTGKQWAALGDAAISFDPLSSQGMYNAMASAMQLTTLIINHNLIHDYTIEKDKSFQHNYTQQINAIWSHYLQHKKLFYSAEMRWKEASFWKRRF